MQFRIFKQVPKIIFGNASLKRLAELMPSKSSANNFFLYVIDDVLRNNEKISSLQICEPDLIEWFSATLGEPSTDQVDSLVSKILETRSGIKPAAIIGIGGGSTMDVAKAISVLLNNHGTADKYQGWDLVPNSGVYKIGIPTIFGSGAEASRTAVLTGPERKFGINSDHSMFDGIILDPEFALSVPSPQNFYTGMDCYIHCVESIEGTMINTLAKANASKALELCEEYFLKNSDPSLIVTASYMGGVSIVNSEVGVCHALSYGLSMYLGIRHGEANCIVFNVLEKYYGDYVTKFKEMLSKHQIVLQKNITKDLSDEIIEKMIDMTMKMERPLTNAFGENWKLKFTRHEIKKLYQEM
jgi:3-deoxy-alpha-D-manno-octulosonate 8-oxidase